ncbi:TPA: hypothetical protein SMO73_001922 [Proteus mirabilis]|nr:hypothetical protein [Proteus mirabilis]
MKQTNYIFKCHYQIARQQLNHIAGCVSGVTKNQSHLIAHIVVKIAAMIMLSTKGKTANDYFAHVIICVLMACWVLVFRI